MTTPIAWPDSLPCPASARTRPTDRRSLQSRPFQARPRQRDRHATQEIVFVPMTLTQATALRDYVRDVLEHTGNWFSSTWALPQGGVGVRRWLAPLSFVHEPGMHGGYWRASGVCEVRGAGMLPVIRRDPILAAHFTSDFTDLTGHTLTPRQWQINSSDPIFLTDAPKFGPGYLAKNENGTSMNPLLSDLRGNLNLNRFGEWQVRFWTRPRLNSEFIVTGGYVVVIQGAEWTGNSVHGGPGGAQLQLSIRDDRIGSEAAGFTTLRVSYNGRSSVDPTTNTDVAMLEVSAGSALIPLDDEWHFVAVCGDATSTRAYVDENLALDDHTPSAPAGSQPMWFDEDSEFTNQVILVIGANTGGIGPSDIWPENTTFTNGRGGGLQDLLITSAPGCVEFTGSTIAVPTSPFSI